MQKPALASRHHSILRFGLLCWAFTIGVANVHSVVIPHSPHIAEKSPDFALSVNDASVPVYTFDRCGRTEYYFAHFSFSGHIKVAITGLSRRVFSKAAISPLAFKIPAEVHANTVSFTLDESRYLIVKIDDLHAIVIAADPMETNVPAPNGPGVFNVVDFGADPAAVKSSTEAFSKAIDSASHYSGKGVVYVPEGVFTVGNLVLKSEVTLYLTGNAVLRSSKDAKEFTRHFLITEPGDGKGRPREEGTWFISTAPYSTNVAIRGRGIIDGNGTFLSKPENGYLLNNLIVSLASNGFTVDGIVGWDAGSWALTPSRSSNVRILNYKGMQSLVTYQDDGVDINECSKVLVKHAIVVSRDDCYSTKSWGPKGIGKNWPGEPQPVNDVLFTDVVAWTTDGAFKVGQGNVQPHTNVTFDHGYVYAAHWPLYLRPTSKPGSPIRNVTFSNIDIETTSAVQKAYTLLKFEIHFAEVSNVLLHNINMRHPSNEPPAVTTLDGGSIRELQFDNVLVAGEKISEIAPIAPVIGPPR